MGTLLSNYKKSLDNNPGVTTRGSAKGQSEIQKAIPVIEVTKDRYDQAMKSLEGYGSTRLVSLPAAVTVLKHLGVPDAKAEEIYNTSPIKKAKTYADLRDFIERSYSSKKVDMFSDE
jgi:hypothetical protein